MRIWRSEATALDWAQVDWARSHVQQPSDEAAQVLVAGSGTGALEATVATVSGVTTPQHALYNAFT